MLLSSFLIPLESQLFTFVFSYNLTVSAVTKGCGPGLGINNELFVYHDQMDTDEALEISIIEPLIYNSSSPPLPTNSLFPLPPPPTSSYRERILIKVRQFMSMRKAF